MPRSPRPSELRRREERERLKSGEVGPLLVLHVRLSEGWLGSHELADVVSAVKVYGHLELAELRDLPEAVDVSDFA